VRGWVGLASAASVFLLAGTLAVPDTPATAAVTTAAVSQALYVNQDSPSCDNSGPGTQATPFCGIQAAANVVDPGQTVYIEAAAPGSQEYEGSVAFTRSGTASAPITFTGLGASLEPEIRGTITLQRADDVTLSTLAIYHTGNGVNVTGSQGITLDRLFFDQQGTFTETSTGVSIDGASSDVTVSRTQFDGGDGTGVLVQPGAANVTITTNSIGYSDGTGIALDGVANADVTSNSVSMTCGDAVSVTGGSSAVAENNLLRADGAGAATGTCAAGAAALDVDSASAPHVQADYNGLNAEAPSTEYSWAGTAYARAANFSAATAQGAHDLDLTIQQSAHPLPATSPAIDSANCDAPGELATDITGNAHVKDPEVSHTGNGTCYADRGAYELEDKLDPDSTFSPTTLKHAVPFPQAVTVPTATTSGWGEAITYTVNFGDGSGTQPVAAGQTITHSYTTAGLYTLTVTAADTGGSTSTQREQVVAATPSAPAITLTEQPGTFVTSAGSAINADDGRFTFSAGADNWEVQSTATIAWGDGTSNNIEEGFPEDHFYVPSGTYTATVTTTDLLGRISTARTTVTVGDEFWPQGPYQVRGGSVAAHGTVKLSLSALDATGARGAYVDVTVTSPKDSGSVTVYPAGTSVPKEATVQFHAGQAASNSTLAVAGTGQDVAFTNSSAGSIDLTVHSYGLDQGATSNGSVPDDTYTPDGPVRALGATTVAGNGNLTLTVAGAHGVPAKAAAVVLDVTAASTKAAGYVTAYADKAANPGLHTADWATGQMVTGLATVPLQDGKVVLHNGSKGSASFTADVVGYFNAYGTGSVFLPSTPYRLLDVKIAAKQSTTLRIAGKNGLPSSGISAAAVNLTESGATRSGTVLGWADKTARPTATSLGYVSGTTTATAGLIPVGSDGVIDLYNSGASTINLIVDLTGAWYR
jgi:hypothetical protein